MNAWQRMLFCAAVGLLAFWPAGDALAASVSGRASTVLEWYDTAEEDTAVPFYHRITSYNVCYTKLLRA